MNKLTKSIIEQIKREMDESRSEVIQTKVVKFLLAVFLIFVIGTAVRYIYQNGII